MSVVDLLDRAQELGATFTVPGPGRLLVSASDPLPNDLVRELTDNKPEIIEYIQNHTGLIDLPWPIGYGGLPVDQVTKAEILTRLERRAELINGCKPEASGLPTNTSNGCPTRLLRPVTIASARPWVCGGILKRRCGKSMAMKVVCLGQASLALEMPRFAANTVSRLQRPSPAHYPVQPGKRPRQ